VPFPVYMCNSCGHVNKDQNPFTEDEQWHTKNFTCG
jgi:hypothetical protein